MRSLTIFVKNRVVKLLSKAIEFVESMFFKKKSREF